jgi:hypothetical protein
MSKSAIRFGPCNNKLYHCVIEILDEISGEKWGFVQSRRKISYVTSTTIKMKFGQSRNVDHVIKTKTGDDKWKSALRFEISVALAEHLKNSNYENRDRIMAKLNEEQMHGVHVNEYGIQIQLNTCREYNTYERTFIHAPTDWIKGEIKSNIEQPKIFSREDYM